MNPKKILFSAAVGYGLYTCYQNMINPSEEKITEVFHEGILAADCGKDSAAQTSFHYVAKHRGENPELQLMLALLYLRQGDYPLARPYFSKLLDSGVYTICAHYGLGLAAYEEDQETDSSKYFETAIKLTPKNLYEELFQAYAHNELNSINAKANFGELIHKLTQNTGPLNFADQFILTHAKFGLALATHNIGKQSEALEKLELLKRENKNYHFLFTGRPINETIHQIKRLIQPVSKFE